MTTSNDPPAGWYPDPSGRHEHRWWDGDRWTEHVASHGVPAVDPRTTPDPAPAGDQSPEQVRDQVQRQAGLDEVPVGGGTLFTEPVLVVNQKARLIEINNEYAIYDARGTQIGAVRQVGQSAAKKALRVLTSLDQFMTHALQIVDAEGTVRLTLTRPAKMFKSRILVGDAAGNRVGEIVQQNVFGKIRFSLESGGRRVGSLDGENWRAWNFNLRDENDAEVARITKTWEGVMKTLFTTADNYVVQIHRPLDEPLRSLVVASAVSVDLALKQDARGFN